MNRVGAAGRDAAPLTRYVVRALAGAEYAVLAGLLEAFPAGLEERVDGEFVVYGEPPDLPGIAEVRREVVSPGWETAYHAHLGRVVAGGFAVRPPWIEGEPDDIVIDPGTAFGAGTHATTRLCLELLGDVRRVRPAAGARFAFADWGAGTGVLGIAAARAGFSPVLAVDVADTDIAASNAAANAISLGTPDPANTVSRTTKNVAVPGFAPANTVSLTTLALDLTRDRAPYAPVVVANLTRPLLEAVARVQERPKVLIASGFLAHDEIALWDLRERERRELEGWAAVVLE